MGVRSLECAAGNTIENQWLDFCGDVLAPSYESLRFSLNRHGCKGTYNYSMPL